MSTQQTMFFITVCLASAALLVTVEAAPPAIAATEEGAQGGESGNNTSDEKKQLVNPMCGQAFYNHSILSSSTGEGAEGNETMEEDSSNGSNNNSTTETVFIQNGCCIYDNGHITDTLTGEKREATDAERQTVRAFLDDGERRAYEWESGLNRRLQNFLAYFFDAFRQPRHGAKVTPANGGGPASEFDMPSMPCFCAPDHCFSTAAAATKGPGETDEGQQSQNATDGAAGTGNNTSEGAENKGAIEETLEREAKNEGSQQQQPKKEDVDGGN